MKFSLDRNMRMTDNEHCIKKFGQVVFRMVLCQIFLYRPINLSKLKNGQTFDHNETLINT